jgi:hypothetical protein
MEAAEAVDARDYERAFCAAFSTLEVLGGYDPPLLPRVPPEVDTRACLLAARRFLVVGRVVAARVAIWRALCAMPLKRRTSRRRAAG